MTSRNLTALIIADEFDVRAFVSKLLTTQLGFSKVTEAHSAEAALELFKTGEKYDVLFCDWEMPRMKGDELLLELRKNPETMKTPFIMMSYKKDKESLVKAIQVGVTNYLVKPLQAAVFLQKVKKTLAEIGRKEIENFKAEIKNPVDITLTDELTVPSALIELTDTTCLVRTPLFAKEHGNIYDAVKLGIKFEGTQIRVDAEIIRIEQDTIDVSTRNFVMVTFLFRDVDKKNESKIERFVTEFHKEKLEQVKKEAPPKPAE